MDRSRQQRFGRKDVEAVGLGDCRSRPTRPCLAAFDFKTYLRFEQALLTSIRALAYKWWEGGTAEEAFIEAPPEYFKGVALGTEDLVADVGEGNRSGVPVYQPDPSGKTGGSWAKLLPLGPTWQRTTLEINLKGQVDYGELLGRSLPSELELTDGRPGAFRWSQIGHRRT